MKFQIRVSLCIFLTSLIFFGCQSKNDKTKIAVTNNDQISTDTVCWVKGKTESAQKKIETFIIDPTTNYLNGAILIKTQQEFISIAEPILFSVFGKGSIVDERPYQISLVGDFWYLEGTNPWDRGGFFCIVINRRTCEVKGIRYEK